ncbi:MAG: hydroxyethylthiazole kinase [Alphaproteobacteria bacterium]|jgi:hydroxyethylthiazole kinase|nr:hydroxyethylthiazole kinase [Alphaproteobacteria bacterium]
MEKLSYYLQTLQKNKPVVCCLTNIVSVDFVCNALISVGASPIVSCSEDEIEELIGISQALYINIGTLDSMFMALAKKAIVAARRQNIPIVLDPVGAGATALRTNFAREILGDLSIVKGNASEVMALVGGLKRSSGVDSLNSVEQAKESATSLAREHGICVAITGREDFIADSQRAAQLHFGCELMSKITGVGCSLGGVIAAFASVSDNYFEAVRMAILYYTICAEIAYKKADSPASFKIEFLDTLYQQPLSQIKEIYYGK